MIFISFPKQDSSRLTLRLLQISKPTYSKLNFYPVIKFQRFQIQESLLLRRLILTKLREWFIGSSFVTFGYIPFGKVWLLHNWCIVHNLNTVGIKPISVWDITFFIHWGVKSQLCPVQVCPKYFSTLKPSTLYILIISLQSTNNFTTTIT